MLRVLPYLEDYKPVQDSAKESWEFSCAVAMRRGVGSCYLGRLDARRVHQRPGMRRAWFKEGYFQAQYIGC